ncbi:MAG: serine/threonine-protein kinase [Bryobacteraceae bacterium]
MTPTRWQQVKHVLNTVLEHEDPHKTGLLADLCGNDAELRAEVERLLEDAGQEADFLETPVELPEVEPKVGPYRILSKIGEGGMGIVYRALREDEQFRMMVALKILRPGLAHDSLVRRFRRERQILARLSHPNVARLLDVGVTRDGRPYFAMELVEGLTLDQFAASASVEEKLHLFDQLCSAVSAAHHNLIVHGDLKPSNVLIAPNSVPKLLDFGISRLMDGESVESTTIALRAMTPAYASPEQLRGEPISTWSDVYSLGLILYELLTGKRPYQVTSKIPEAILREIRDNPPPKPSEVSGNRHLAGDLDNIVLKAIHFEPDRRYASVDQLAADLQRYKQGHPVLARPDTYAYRALKFAGRNRLAVAAFAGILLALTAGIIATARQARIAREERARAERRFQDVRRMANIMMFQMDEALSTMPGGIEVRKTMVWHSLAYLDGLARESNNDLELQRELAAAYEKMGDVLGRPLTANLGDTAGALASYRKALAIRETVAQQQPRNAAAKQDLASIYQRMSAILKVTGDHKQALALDHKTIAIRSSLLQADPKNRQLQRELASSYTSLGGTLSQLGQWNEVLETRQEALKLWERVAAREDVSIDEGRGLALAHTRLGSILLYLKRPTEAMSHYAKALDIDRSLAKAHPQNTQLQSAMAQSLVSYGLALHRTGNTPEALKHYHQALPAFEALTSADASDMRSMSMLATCRYRIAEALLQMRAASKALEEAQASLEIRLDLARRNSVSVGARGEVAESKEQMGDIYMALGRKEQAASMYEQARASLADMRDKGQSSASGRIDLERVESKLKPLGL